MPNTAKWFVAAQGGPHATATQINFPRLNVDNVTNNTAYPASTSESNWTMPMTSSTVEINSADGFIGNAVVTTTGATVSSVASKFTRGFFVKNGDATNGVLISDTSGGTAYLLGPGEVKAFDFYSLTRLLMRSTAGTAKVYWIGC